MTDFAPKRAVLLTGAGFTNTVDAPLAKGMWDWIFQKEHIRKHPRLREALLDDLNFEDVYQKVIFGDYTVQEKIAFGAAVLSAYKDLDDIIRNGSPWEHVGHYALDGLINSFNGTSERKGFFFTLNQDLYVERWYVNGERPYLPGVPPQNVWFNGDVERRGEMEERRYITLPTESQLEPYKRQFLARGTSFCYLKLHGSFNWRSSDGTQQLVIGAQKEDQIRREPALSWYLDIFEYVLNQPERWMLVIGYGFQDHHINLVLAKAVTNSNLRFVVVTPSEKEQLFETMKKAPHGKDLMKGFSGHVNYRLNQIFPKGQSVGLRDVNSAGWRLLKVSFFDKSAE